MAFVSITRLRLRSVRYLPGFVLHAVRSSRQCRRAPGFIVGSMLNDRALTFWTMTLWHDAAAMRAYMTRDAHRAAMPKLQRWCDEASIVHWDQDGIALPNWQDGVLRMREQGRPSMVRFPSQAHAPLAFAAPRTTRVVSLRPIGA